MTLAHFDYTVYVLLSLFLALNVPDDGCSRNARYLQTFLIIIMLAYLLNFICY